MKKTQDRTGLTSGTSGTSDRSIVPDHNGTNRSKVKTRKFDGSKESLELDNIIRNAVAVTESVTVSELSLAPALFCLTVSVLVTAGKGGRTTSRPGNIHSSVRGGRAASASFSGSQQTQPSARGEQEGEQEGPLHHHQAALTVFSLSLLLTVTTQ